MKRAALAFRMHSRWGVRVAVCREANSAADSIEVIDRRRIVIVGGAQENGRETDPKARGPNQPYHNAATVAPPEAERYLTKCAAVSEGLALESIGEAIRESDRCYRRVGAAILLASGRPLPPLARFLRRTR
jgi:hypothetical protein